MITIIDNSIPVFAFEGKSYFIDIKWSHLIGEVLVFVNQDKYFDDDETEMTDLMLKEWIEANREFWVLEEQQDESLIAK